MNINDEFDRKTLKDVGMNEEIIKEASSAINHTYKTVNSFIIIKNGYLVCENYYNGHNASQKAHIASVTKSVISALIGIALDKNIIKSIDCKVIDFFPEYKTKITDSLIEQVTIKDLLTMSSGILWRIRAMREQMMDRMMKSPDWIEFILSLPVEYDMRGKFLYNTSSSQLLSAIISKASKMSTEKFADEYLFKPIGIKFALEEALKKEVSGEKASVIEKTELYKTPIGVTNLEWVKDPQGYNTGGFGLSLSPIELAKFGYLFLKNGMWGEKQIISSKWVKDSTTTKIEGNNNGTYGYHWWISDDKYHKFFALGWGGQYVMVVPELDLVSVITSRTDLVRWNNQWDLFGKYIIPAAEGLKTV